MQRMLGNQPACAIAVALLCFVTGCNALPNATLGRGDALPATEAASDHLGTAGPVDRADLSISPEKVASPRTFPRAVGAYLKSLHEPLPEPKKKDDPSPEEKGCTETKFAANAEDGEPKEEDGKGANDKNGEKGANGGKEKEPEPTWLGAHAQATMITQAHDQFRSPYVGPLSLLPNEASATSLTATLFLAARLWECDGNSGELVFNPEIAGGKGFSGVNGVAGFPNGDITRVGVVEPTPFIARLFYRQTWGLGGEQEKVEDEIGENQIPGTRDVNRITVSVGKFAFTDMVDDNRYSHDPRTQFENWALMYNGAWDYPANVRGYSYGLAIDYNQKDWALRYGVMAEPKFANGPALDPHFLKANGHALEWEGRYKCGDHPGKLRLLAYLNRAHMGDYREALAAMPVKPDVTLTRAYRYKYGCGASWDQELTKDLGVFARLGWDDGHTETWAFTPIDRTACLGLLLKGRLWRRSQDQVGLAGAINGLAKDHRDYLTAGGLDFSIGDGQLHYGLEGIVEIFYNLELAKGLFVTADFQEVNNPAYNRDRGPVSIGTLRVHTEF